MEGARWENIGGAPFEYWVAVGAIAPLVTYVSVSGGGGAWRLWDVTRDGPGRGQSFNSRASAMRAADQLIQW